MAQVSHHQENMPQVLETRKEHGFLMGMTRSLLQRREFHDNVWSMRRYTCHQENMSQVLKTGKEGTWVFNGDDKVIITKKTIA